MKTNRKYNWNPDLPDHRDFAYGVTHHTTAVKYPTVVSLVDKLLPVFDQGQEGSCTANSLSGALGFIHPGYVGSRQQIYHDERVIENDVKQDNGAQIRDGIRVLNKKGAIAEGVWPYTPGNFAKAPPAKLYLGAVKIASYSRLSSAEDFHNCLASGFPFVIGFTVYDSFESDAVAKTGVVPMPSKKEKPLGGHAVLVVGYDDHARTYLVRNSWGADWGQKGNFTIPQAYLENTNLADDAWTIRL